MATLTLMARTIIVIVFGLAAVTKLLARSESRATFEEFGAGARLSVIGATLLAPAELVVAVAVLLVPTARLAAGVAILLLLIFITGITNALAQGRRPSCRCFGALRPTSIGTSTIVRNVALLMIAAIVLIWGPGPALDGWLASRNGAELALVALVLLGIAATALYTTRSVSSSVGLIPTPTVDGPHLSLGDPAPEFSLSDEHGEAQSIQSLTADGRSLVLVFASSGCGSCLELMGGIGRLQTIFADRLRIVVVAIGEPDSTRRVFEEHGAKDVLIGLAGEVQRAYGVIATPSAVAVTPRGAVAGKVVAGKDAIEDLIRLTLRQFDPMYDPWSRTTNAA